jgi:hypothetical protein
MPLAPQIAQNLDGQIPWLPVLADLAPEPVGTVDTTVEPIPVANPWLVASDVLAQLDGIDVGEVVVRPIPHTGGHTQNLRPKQLKQPLLGIWRSLTVETNKPVCVDSKTDEQVECKPDEPGIVAAEAEAELFEDELDEATKPIS